MNSLLKENFLYILCPLIISTFSWGKQYLNTVNSSKYKTQFFVSEINKSDMFPVLRWFWLKMLTEYMSKISAKHVGFSHLRNETKSLKNGIVIWKKKTIFYLSTFEFLSLCRKLFRLIAQKFQTGESKTPTMSSFWRLILWHLNMGVKGIWLNWKITSECFLT